MSRFTPARFAVARALPSLREAGLEASYKPAMDSPFDAVWPELKSASINTLWTGLAKVLDPLGKRRKQLQKDTKASRPRSKKTKAKLPDPDSRPVVPQTDFIFGINQITKCLEDTVQLKSKGIVIGDADNKKTLAIVFLCKGDIQPTQLYAHLPALCQLSSVLLIPFPKGFESKLAHVLVMKRVSAIGLIAGSEWETLLSLACSSIPQVNVPWLNRDKARTIDYEQLKMSVQVGVKFPKAKKNKQGHNLKQRDTQQETNDNGKHNPFTSTNPTGNPKRKGQEEPSPNQARTKRLKTSEKVII